MAYDIIHWVLVGLSLIAFVLVMMIPFFGYLYWLNTKQTRYFKKLASKFKLTYSSKGNKFKRDFPELNGYINGIQCFVAARRTKGRHGTNARTRNHYPIISIQAAVKPMEFFTLNCDKNKTELSCPTSISVGNSTLNIMQSLASKYHSFSVQQVKTGVLEVKLLNELSNQQQFDKTEDFLVGMLVLAKELKLN